MSNLKIIHPSVNQKVQAFQALTDDQHLVHELIIQTARWLQSTGSTQWSGLLHGHDNHNLPGAISRGEVIAFRETDEVELAGSVILQQQPSEWDRKLWNLAEADQGTAVYLHRLVINRRNSGKGLGRDMMSWIEKGIQFAGKDRIRLDCIANNEKLNSFYQQCGYTYKGETNGFSIYEKML
ncbi:Acetyltransferase (GNAT) family protein [compost metagenome]